MQEIFDISVEEVVPSLRSILSAQGIPSWVQPDERTTHLANDALALYRQKAVPRAMLTEISLEAFETVFEGLGLNQEESPVNSIARTSEDLALFAVTMGEEVSRTIAGMFDGADFALASMLDAAASEGAEMTAQAVENIYRRHLGEIGGFDHTHGTLRFSPGYCGWHITGQKRLFQALGPDRIGITLNESCLMNPIKSISGVIISGRKEIFEFEDVFSFCHDCATHTCREWIRALFDE